jgi:ADP-heptose:LPS heptosyltransferase
MKTSFKRRIDFYVGLPLLLAFDVLARFLGAVLRRSHEIEPVRTILVAKFQGMGSVVIAQPALARLRGAYPDARIVFWCAKATEAIARTLPEIDEVVTFDDSSPMKALVSLVNNLDHLWKMRVDWAFDLEVYSKLSSIFILLTCARNRAGFAVDTVRGRRFVHTHLFYFNRYTYLGRAYECLVGIVAGEEDTEDRPDPQWVAASEAMPDIPKPYVVVNLHAGELCLERRWPRGNYQTLITAMLEGHEELQVVLIGYGPAEEEEAGKIDAHPRLLNLAGRMSLAETIRCLAHADLVVSNDTAPLHLALSTEAPVVGLFGPTRAASYFPPARPNAIALEQEVYCSPCVHHWEPIPCGGDNQCMKQLSVQRVWEACEKLLSGEGGLTSSTRFPSEPVRRRPLGLIFRKE